MDPDGVKIAPRVGMLIQIDPKIFVILSWRLVEDVSTFTRFFTGMTVPSRGTLWRGGGSWDFRIPERLFKLVVVPVAQLDRAANF